MSSSETDESSKNKKSTAVSGAIPWVSLCVGNHGVNVGGFHVLKLGDGKDNRQRYRTVMTVTLDNLLKGAATQAIQNANLCMGLPEYQNIDTESESQSIAIQNPATLSNHLLKKIASVQRQANLTRTYTFDRQQE